MSARIRAARGNDKRPPAASEEVDGPGALLCL
jgi:hypothetical protein